jgi:hypothetical protein
LVTHQGEGQPFVQNVMTLKSCSPIVGVDVMSFDAEIFYLHGGYVLLSLELSNSVEHDACLYIAFIFFEKRIYSAFIHGIFFISQY